jgi:protein SCO1
VGIKSRSTGKLVSLFVFCLLAWGVSDHPRALADDKGGSRFPKVMLKTQDGKEVSFSDDLIKNKIVIINFMYAQCEECKRGTKNLVKVQDALGDRFGKEVFIYSISLDPEHDTPEVLKEYAKTFDPKPRWTFLTGKAEDIKALRSKLGLNNLSPELQARLGLRVEDQVKDADQKLHTGMIAIGYDDFNRWSKISVLSTTEQILQVIERLKPPSDPKK